MLLYLLFFIRFWNTVEHRYSHCPNNVAASDSFSSTQELQTRKLMTPAFSQFKSSLVSSHLLQFPPLFQEEKNPMKHLSDSWKELYSKAQLYRLEKDIKSD